MARSHYRFSSDPSSPSRLSVTPHPRVTLRRQIAVQVAAGLRAGRWHGGDRLPSVRALARRLGVDRGTVGAAYRDLADAGHVEVREGSGVYAVHPAGGPEGAAVAAGAPDPEAAVGAALQDIGRRARAAGLGRPRLIEMVERWSRAAASGPVRVVAKDQKLAAVWAAEVRAAVGPAGRTVDGLSLAAARSDPDTLAGGVVLTGPAVRAEVEALAPPWIEVTSLRPGPPPLARRLLARVPAGTVLAAVSRSRVVLDELQTLAAALRGGEVAVAVAFPEDRPRIRRRVRVARFVLVDVACREAVADLVPEGRRLTLRHLAADDLRRLAVWPGASRESGERLPIDPAAPRTTTDGRHGP